MDWMALAKPFEAEIEVPTAGGPRTRHAQIVGVTMDISSGKFVAIVDGDEGTQFVWLTNTVRRK